MYCDPVGGSPDPRLGVRSLGGWLSGDTPTSWRQHARQSERLADRIKQLADTSPIYVEHTNASVASPFLTTRGEQTHQSQCQLWDIA